MLQASGVFLKRGSLQLFENLTFTVHPGHKVGVVGRNGTGKSTLFQLILGRLQPEDGDLTMPPGWEITHLAQQVRVTERPAIEHVIDGHHRLRAIEHQLAKAEAARDDLLLANLHADFTDAGGHEAKARAGTILHGLGFTPEEFDKPFREFSGGMRVRLNLAKALMAPCDLLLLDEPTNHLDLETTLWLESWLRKYSGTLLVVAHDRAFLDGVCDEILHLTQHRADSYRGNYSSFERQRAQALAVQQAEHARQQARIRHVQQFVDRFRAKASKARQAQSRLKALERMRTAAPLHAESPYRFHFENPDRMSYPLIALEGVTIGYGDRNVLSNITLSLLPGSRVGILGANGAGKSTLLKCLVGDLTPRRGELTRGTHAQVGYVAQHPLERLRADATPVQTILSAYPAMTEQRCRDYLGGWAFGADKAERPLATLSGGEKVRLLLALVALEKPAVLILDEPTNHLDLDMREALALALQDYTGALLMVSHDRALLERSVDEFWIVKDGHVKPFTGDLEAYAALQETADSPANTGNTRKQRRRDAAARRQAEKPLRDRVAASEAALETLTNELTKLEARLANPDLYNGMAPDELSRLLAEAGRLRKDAEDTEQAWLEAMEELERLTSD